MNFFKRALLDRRLKKALANNKCRLGSGIKGLRGDSELTLEYGVKPHHIKIASRVSSIGAYPTLSAAPISLLKAR